MATYHGTTGLYGIFHSNRKIADHWGKNCFNSSFPTALACYMLDHDIPAIYVHLAPTGDPADPIKIACSKISIRDVFNCEKLTPADLEFQFETAFESFKEYTYDQLDGIDLVVAKNEGAQLRPIEIKLTAFPDNSTVSKPKNQWGSELVIRSATTMYAALSIFDSITKDHTWNDIRDCFETVCSSIGDWRNNYEMTHRLSDLIDRLNAFELEYYKYQKPLLMQTLWKTKGKSPEIEEDAFQLVIWSDFAFEKVISGLCNGEAQEMSRPMRATARMIKCLWDLSKSGKINIGTIYREMTYDVQNDKEFSVPGRKWRELLSEANFDQFPVKKEKLSELINSDYIDKLSPERRLDQSIFFTYKR